MDRRRKLGNKYTGSSEIPAPSNKGTKPGEKWTNQGEVTIPSSGKGRISVSHGKYGGEPREDNLIDKVINKVFGG